MNFGITLSLFLVVFVPLTSSISMVSAIGNRDYDRAGILVVRKFFGNPNYKGAIGAGIHCTIYSSATEKYIKDDYSYSKTYWIEDSDFEWTYVSQSKLLTTEPSNGHILSLTITTYGHLEYDDNSAKYIGCTSVWGIDNDGDWTQSGDIVDHSVPGSYYKTYQDYAI